MTASRAPKPGSSAGREGLGILALAVGVLAVVVYRATLGLSLYDDTYYVTVAWRIAHGVRPLAGEMSIQSAGQLLPAAFVWVWERLVGSTGIMLAYRLFYVALAALTAVVLYRVLRRVFSASVAALAAIVPVICPPFNILAASYNTVALLAVALAFVLAYTACTRRSRVAACATGVCLAVASVSYIPLTLGCLALFVTMAILVRDRRLVLWTVVGGVAGAFVMLSPLLGSVSVEDVRRTLRYAAENVSSFDSPLVKLGKGISNLAGMVGAPALIPAWILAVIAAVPRAPKTLRLWCLLLLPIAAGGADIVWSMRLPGAAAFGHTAAMWLVKFTAVALLPAVVFARESKLRDALRLLGLATPCSVVGVAVILYSTNAGTAAATYLAGLVPLTIVVLAIWAESVRRLGRDRAMVLAWLVVLLPAILMLFATAFGDARPITFQSTIASGPYEGLRTTKTRRDELRALQAAGKRYVKPSDRVTFLGERSGYFLVGGVPYTITIWLNSGPTDQAALDYFKRSGAMPDVVFVDDIALRKVKKDSYAVAAETDPLINRLLTDYRLADTAAEFGVFVRR